MNHSDGAYEKVVHGKAMLSAALPKAAQVTESSFSIDAARRVRLAGQFSPGAMRGHASSTSSHPAVRRKPSRPAATCLCSGEVRSVLGDGSDEVAVRQDW